MTRGDSPRADSGKLDQFGYPVGWTIAALRAVHEWRNMRSTPGIASCLPAAQQLADGEFAAALDLLDVGDGPSSFWEVQLRREALLGLGDGEGAARALEEMVALDAARARRVAAPPCAVIIVFSLPAYVGSMRVHAQVGELLSDAGADVLGLAVRDDPHAYACGFPVRQVGAGEPVWRAIRELASSRDGRVVTAVATYHDLASAAVARSGPVVFFSAGDPSLTEFSTLPPAYQAALRDAYSVPARIAAHAEFVTTMVGRNFDRRASFVPVHVDDAFYDQARPSRDDEFRSLIVGSPAVWHKGTSHVVTALSALRERGHRLECTWVSPDPVPADAAPGAEVLVNPPREEVFRAFARCDVLVYPSYAEGWGLPPLEAMAAGALVITTRNGGSDGYVRDGENCLVVPWDSPDAIAAALEQLLSSPRLRERLVRGGQETAEKYRRANVVNALVSVVADAAPDLGT